MTESPGGSVSDYRFQGLRKVRADVLALSSFLKVAQPTCSTDVALQLGGLLFFLSIAIQSSIAKVSPLTNT